MNLKTPGYHDLLGCRDWMSQELASHAKTNNCVGGKIC